MNQNLLEDWVMSTFETLAAEAPFGDGRVQLGFAFDGFFLPKEYVLGVYEKVKALGIKLTSTHASRGAVFGRSSVRFYTRECHSFTLT